jgi:ABC-type nitrate/sulfonate/bicarbonate transport system substrate-binding protein
MRKSIVPLAMLWAASAAAQNLTVGVAPSIDNTLLIVATKHGFLAKEGVKAELQLFDSSPGALQGVVAGRADITNNTEPPHLAARARGGKILQIMTGYQTGKQNASVVTDAIHKDADFVGKAIGVQRGSGAHYHLAWFLQRSKIPADKVTLKFMDTPDQIAALARNDVQAFFAWEPYVSKASETVPKARIYHRNEEDGLLFSGNVVMREDIVKGQRDLAVKTVKGLIAAADWIQKNPMDAAKVANEVVKGPSVELVAKQIQNLTWPGEFRRKVRDQEVSIAEWGIGVGLFPSKDAKKLVDELIDPSIIKAAAPSRTDF